MYTVLASAKQLKKNPELEEINGRTGHFETLPQFSARLQWARAV
jgi:hypothetical protein